MAEHRTIKASAFKARCLRPMDEVAEGGPEIVITKRGRPVSRLVAYREKPDSLFGIDRGRIRLVGTVVGPVDDEWEADPETERAGGRRSSSTRTSRSG